MFTYIPDSSAPSSSPSFLSLIHSIPVDTYICLLIYYLVQDFNNPHLIYSHSSKSEENWCLSWCEGYYTIILYTIHIISYTTIILLYYTLLPHLFCSSSSSFLSLFLSSIPSILLLFPSQIISPRMFYLCVGWWGCYVLIIESCCIFWPRMFYRCVRFWGDECVGNHVLSWCWR